MFGESTSIYRWNDCIKPWVDSGWLHRNSQLLNQALKSTPLFVCAAQTATMNFPVCIRSSRVFMAGVTLLLLCPSVLLSIDHHHWPFVCLAKRNGQLGNSQDCCCWWCVEGNLFSSLIESNYGWFGIKRFEEFWFLFMFWITNHDEQLCAPKRI